LSRRGCRTSPDQYSQAEQVELKRADERRG